MIQKMNSDSKSEGRVHPLRKRLKEATSDAILSAAAEVFAEQGLHAAKMESIAERAGVSVGTLYNHFEDRAALLAALTKRRRTALLTRVDAALAEAQGRPFAAQLRAFVHALFTHLGTKDAFSRVLMQEPPDSAPRATNRAESIAELNRRLDVLIDLGVRSGAVRPEGRAFYPALLMGMVRGAMVREQEEGHTGTLEAWADEVVRVFLKGVEV